MAFNDGRPLTPAYLEVDAGGGYVVVDPAGTPVPGLGGAATLHSTLTGRSDADQHPISSITGLQAAIDGKSAVGHGHVVADLADFVASVDGRIALASINALADVLITAPTVGQVLKWNGSAWINDTDGGGGGGGGGDALTSNPLSQFAATTSAQLRGVLTDETGIGAAVFAESPVLVTPNLGTPSAGNLANCTGLPILAGVAGLAAGIATWLGNPTSANLRAAVTDEDGDGALLFALTPVSITTDTNLVRATHGNRLLVVDSATPVTLTVEDDATGTWAAQESMAIVNIGAGLVTLVGDGTSSVTAIPGYALTIPQNGSGGLQRAAANAWLGYGSLAVQSQATWEAGVSTAETVISPAKLDAAITALGGGGGGGAVGGFLENGPTFSDVPVGKTNSLVSTGAMVGTNPAGTTATAATTLFDTSFNFTRVTLGSAAAADSYAMRRGATSGIGWYPGAAGTAPLKFRGAFGPNDALSACRSGIGFFTTDPGAAAQPSSLLNCAFMGADSTDTNMQIMRNDGSGTCTKIDLGASFPANATATHMYELTLLFTPGATRQLTYEAVDLTNVASYTTGTVDTDLPTAGASVMCIAFRNTAANTTSCAFDYMGMWGGREAGL